MKLEAILGNELTQILHNTSHNLALIAEDHIPQTPLKTSKAKAQEIEQETNKCFENLASDFSAAAKVLFSKLKDLSKTHPEIDMKTITREFDRAKNNSKDDLLKRNLTLDEMQTNSTTLEESSLRNRDPLNKESVHLSETTAKALYEAASSVLNDKQYEDAQRIFSLLSTIDPTNYNYWVGYGHSSYFNQQYDISILAYFVATSLHPGTPWPMIWAANACEAKKNSLGALDLLKRAKEVIVETNLKDSGSLLNEIQNRMSRLQFIK